MDPAMSYPKPGWLRCWNDLVPQGKRSTRLWPPCASRQTFALVLRVLFFSTSPPATNFFTRAVGRYRGLVSLYSSASVRIVMALSGLRHR